jgi:CRISPR-associated protein Cmr5
MRTLNQERSEYALKNILDKGKNDYTAFLAGTPSMILKNGFGHTLAFWLSKGKGQHKFAFDVVQNWLIDKGFIESEKDNKSFLLKLSKCEQKDYLSAQKEALLLLEWVKRYAQAFLK